MAQTGRSHRSAAHGERQLRAQRSTYPGAQPGRAYPERTVSEISLSDAVRAIYQELLDAAWTRVHAGPVERERHRGPFSVNSVGGTLALAAVDLVVLQQEAARAQLYLLSDDVDGLVERPLALLAADAVSTLLLLARALAHAIGHPELAGREELDRLISEQIDLDDVSDATDDGLLVEAVEQVSRITSEVISHGVESFGPIVIHVPVVIAIANVLSATIAQLVELLDDGAADDER